MLEKDTAKKNLLILSDIRGISKATYLQGFFDILQAQYSIEILDTPALGGVKIDGKEQSQIHTDMLATGVDCAVKKLLVRQSVTGILAFSIGGWVAWRAMLQALKVDKLVAVSATRLRYEERWPEQGSIHLMYGGADPYRPKQYWPTAKNITTEVLTGQPHTLYENGAFAEKLTKPFLVD